MRQQLERSEAKKVCASAPVEGHRSWPIWLTGRRKKAQLFRCKEATS